ncbi:MAG TPA: PspC domain-containing protein, partial [Roseivirga sp.]
MKKNISINISGIIFHIEEDGYKKLKDYLDSINKYFSSYDDSEEIIADIESRIAEIFLEKLEEGGKQVISNEEINQLISTMGEISDFEAMEEEDDFASSQKQSQKKEEPFTKKNESRNAYEPRKLYRDLNNQVVGGVASGVAKYFNIDPLWIRIAFVLSFFAGFGILIYIIMWMVIPGSTQLKDDDSIKKFYRDPDDRVLGGVASGLANYFKTDTIIFRIIFIALFFGFGTGFLAYIILWIIAPQAKSLTDKMQMKGERVTLSNIDSNIKRGKEEDLGPKGEGAFTKILLFPFRLIGRIFRALGSALTPLLLFIAAAFRVFIGAIVSIVGISVMFSILVMAG